MWLVSRVLSVASGLATVRVGVRWICFVQFNKNDALQGDLILFGCGSLITPRLLLSEHSGVESWAASNGEDQREDKGTSVVSSAAT